MNNISPEFATALVKAQGMIEGAVKGSNNPAFRSKYADLGACWEACRDALQTNNIAVLQFPTAAPVGSIGLATSLVFGPTGESISEAYCLPLKDASSAQSAGSAITYARRYALCAVIGICPVDDDGNAASKPASARSEPAKAQDGPPVGFTHQQVPAKLIRQFEDAAAQGKDEMKQVYSVLKNASVAEPAKTEALTVWAKRIKETT